LLDGYTPKSVWKMGFLIARERKGEAVMKAIRVDLIKALVLAAAIVSLAPKAVSAERLGADVISLFPEKLGEFAYADLKAARSQKSLAVLEAQFLPGILSQIQSLLAAERIDLLQQADGVAWGFIPASPYSAADSQTSAVAATGEQIVGIAIGDFNSDSVEAILKQRKVASLEMQGETLYALQPTAGPNDLFVVFLGSDRIAFGHRSALQKMLEVRSRATQGVTANDELFRLINEANGSGAIWAVLGSHYTKSTVMQLIPDLGSSAQPSKLVKTVKNLVLKLDADGGMDGQFQMILDSPDSANAMGQLLQLGLLYESYQLGKENKSLAGLLSRAQIFPSGDRVTLRLSVNEDEAAALPEILAAANSRPE
jgi:hypothetical protein